MLGIGVTTAIYLLISIGSCLLFGEEINADVLQNFTVQGLTRLLPSWLCWAAYLVVRLSFLISVVTLYPLMVHLFLHTQNSGNCMCLVALARSEEDRSQLLQIVIQFDALKLYPTNTLSVEMPSIRDQMFSSA